MQNTLTMSQLGRMGRFANALFQYMFLRIYAKRWNCRLQLPPWVGNELFGTDEPPITVRLPTANEKWKTDRSDGLGHLDEQVPPVGAEFVNTDWTGYAQYHTAWYRPHREKIYQWLRPLPHIAEPIDAGFSQLRRAGNTVVGFHIRRGDFGQLSFHLTPIAWYRRWLDENWDRLDSPVLFIATEDRSVVDEFAEWSPYTTDDLGIQLASSRANYNYLTRDVRVQEPWQMDFFPDFFCLSQCDVLVTSNSTFSFVAGMLNEKLEEFWRSSLPHAYFEQVDPWNSRPFRCERVADYPDLEGISCEQNPYW